MLQLKSFKLYLTVEWKFEFKQDNTCNFMVKHSTNYCFEEKIITLLYKNISH